MLYNTGIIDRLMVTNKDIYLHSLSICSNFKIQFWLLSHYQFLSSSVLGNDKNAWQSLLLTRNQKKKKKDLRGCVSVWQLPFTCINHIVHVGTCFNCESQQLIQSCEISHITLSKYNTVNERPKLMVKVQVLTVI